MSAEDILRLIEEMESGERWKLLDKMYDLYFNKSGHYEPLDEDY
ncbi:MULTISPECIES: hypothetical protein [Bacillus cereus group]|nr:MULTISPECIES: hypothetical protein [Bacillus cereus group]EEL06342.1 hypothetical protein bcere0014_20570 [Bacillus cereus BDRD-ST196]AIW85362.1 hypothetical protein bwei_2739 [Bacillus mycoides]MDZ4427299.1 hypothetical protein [Bacillus cereus]MEC0017448.1 hypothetical protein [Bacillus anthracis]MED0993665.1 hypothetical protein [Bacillus nitratireducens]